MIEAYRVTVTTTPTVLVDGPATVLMVRESGNVFLGPSDVSATTGFTLGNIVQLLDIKNHDALYGVVDATAGIVQVLKFS